jgi:SAM-dependent methyltransferase
MKTLDEIGIAHQTDKASQFSRTYAKPHDYLRHLERFFEPMRDMPIKLLEIGVGGGESVLTWLEYFPNAKVFGVDLVSKTNPWNTPGASDNDRYEFFCGSQSDYYFWQTFTATFGGGFNIIIDDGSHYASDMKAAFTSLWHHLKSGGIYVVEDLNFDGKSKEWLESFISHIHGSTFDVDSIYFARELCVMRKR